MNETCAAMDTNHPVFGKGWGSETTHCTKPAEVEAIDQYGPRYNSGFRILLCREHAESMRFAATPEDVEFLASSERIYRALA